MAGIGSIKVMVGEGEDYVRIWLAAANAARLDCALTGLSTTREGEILHKDIVSCRGFLYKIIVKSGVARAEKIAEGSVLPESVRLTAKTQPKEEGAALEQWLAAAKALSCYVLHTGPALVCINGIGTVVHGHTGRRYEVLLTGDELVAVAK